MMDNEFADMPEVPDVPDEASGEGNTGDGLPDGLLGKLAGPLGRIDVLLAPARPVLERVPTPILTGVGSGLAVVVVIVLVAALVGGRAGAPVKAVEAREGASATELDEQPITRRPTLIPTPPGPTATPTPVVWEPNGEGWIGYGYAAPTRLDMLRPDKLLLFDDTRTAYTIITRFAVLTASGPGAPQWGIILAYLNNQNHLLLEGSTDRDRHPIFTLVWAKDGNGGPIGNTTLVPDLPFWGRDTHEIHVAVAPNRVKAWVDGRVLGQWENRHIADGGRKGLFVWLGSRMRFDTFAID